MRQAAKKTRAAQLPERLALMQIGLKTFSRYFPRASPSTGAGPTPLGCFCLRRFISLPLPIAPPCFVTGPAGAPDVLILLLFMIVDHAPSLPSRQDRPASVARFALAPEVAHYRGDEHAAHEHAAGHAEDDARVHLSSVAFSGDGSNFKCALIAPRTVGDIACFILPSSSWVTFSSMPASTTSRTCRCRALTMSRSASALS